MAMPKPPKPNLTAIAGGKGGGSGPEDPTMDQRVASLEADMKDVKASLKIIEAAVLEIKHLPRMSDYASLQKDFGALRADVQKDFGALRADVQKDFGALRADAQKDFGALRADVARIEGRVSNMPTWWMLVTALIATWSVGAGIVFTLVRSIPK
jgi:hypothetical protein